jgi:hypothetical protein
MRGRIHAFRTLLSPRTSVHLHAAVNVSHSPPSETFIVVLLLTNLLTVILLPVMSVFPFVCQPAKLTARVGYCYDSDHGWMP